MSVIICPECGGEIQEIDESEKEELLKQIEYEIQNDPRIRQCSTCSRIWHVYE